MFLYNGSKLDVHSQQKLKTKFKANAKITVFDPSGVIGLLQPKMTNKDEIINIQLEASTGLKVFIPISVEKTIEELFKIYAQKAYISENTLGDKLVFLYNGTKLDVHSQQKLKTKFKANAKITVFDQYGVLL